MSADPYINCKLVECLLAFGKNECCKKRLKEEADNLYWLKESFPELIDPLEYKEMVHLMSRAGAQLPTDFKSGYECHVRTFLSEQFTSLCIGVGTLGHNSRNHDISTSYTVNYNDDGEPHVDDDIRMMPYRNYLDLRGKPHQFETVYIEVSCGARSFLTPDFMTFLNRHLKPGGKVYMEMNPYFLAGQSIPAGSYEAKICRGDGSWYPLLDGMSEINEITKETIKGRVEEFTIEYCKKGMQPMLNVRSKFSGDIKAFFDCFGFVNPRLMQQEELMRVQVRTFPVEWTKTTLIVRETCDDHPSIDLSEKHRGKLNT